MVRLRASAPDISSAFAPTVVHALTDFPYAIIAAHFARAHKIPFIMNAIGTYSVAPLRRFPDKQLFMPALRSAARIIAISAYTKQTFSSLALYNGLIEVAHLPVAPFVPYGSEDESILRNLPQGKRFVLTIASSRLSGRKGFDVVRSAMDVAMRTHPEIHLVAVGPGTAASSRYTSFPALGAAQLAALMRHCSLFVALPRRSGDYFEGYGLVYLEAGLYGKPVVASSSGGIPEAVQDGVTGIVVPEDDPSSASAAICRIIEDGGLASRLGAAGMRLARARNWDDYIRRIIPIYESDFRIR